MNYPRKNPIYLKQFYTSLSNQIKFENLKSSLPLKKFSFHLLTSLNLRKLKNEIASKKAHLLYLANSYFYNCKTPPCILHQHRFFRNLRKNKDIVVTKPDKGSGVVILDDLR